MERREARALSLARRERDRRWMTFRQYATDYLAWSVTVHRSQRTAQYEVHRLITLFGDIPLDVITHADVERCVRTLGETLAPASVNRLRDRLSGMFRRALRLGLVPANPVKDIPKLKEAGSRLALREPRRRRGTARRAPCGTSPSRPPSDQYGAPVVRASQTALGRRGPAYRLPDGLPRKEQSGSTSATQQCGQGSVDGPSDPASPPSRS
jgi:hypothetical protein